MGGQTSNLQDFDRIEDLEFIKDDLQNFVSSRHEDIVLILGRNMGKTVVTKLLTGKGDTLVSEVTGPDQFKVIFSNTSQTEIHYPRLEVDLKTNISFYECPKTVYMPDTVHDIILYNYFMQRVINNAKRVKMVLIISHSAILQNGNYDEYEVYALLKTIYGFKDVDSIRDGIALVITDVKNQYEVINGTSVLISDDTVMGKVEDHLINARDQIGVDQCSDEIKDFCLSMAKLINIALEKKNGKYVRMRILRKPNQAGPISELPVIKNQTSALEQLIHENIDFVKVKPNSVRYNLPDPVRYIFENVVEQINQEMFSCVNYLGREMRQYLSKTPEYYTIVNLLEIEFEAMYNTRTNEITEQNMSEILKDLNYEDVARKCETSFVLNQNKMQFLQDVTEYKINSRPWKLIHSIRDVAEYLVYLRKGHPFITDLYKRLSEYDVQIDTTKYNVANIADFGIAGRKQGILVNSENFNQFLQKVIELGLDNRTMNDFAEDRRSTLHKKLKVLNNVLDHTLKRKTKYICSGTRRLVVKGNFVKLSKVTTDVCQGRVEILDIHAYNTVIIDTDLVRVGNRLKVNIISPTWLIVGKRKIDLNENPRTYRVTYRNITLSREWLRSDALPTNLRFPGDNVNNFFGISKQFVNGENLKIISNGKRIGVGLCKKVLQATTESIFESMVNKYTYQVITECPGDKFGLVVNGSLHTELKVNVMNAPHVLSSVREFKDHAKLVSKDGIRYQYLTRFLQEMDEIPGTYNVYDTLSLVEELQKLENEGISKDEGLVLLPMYHRLLNTITEYAANPKRNERSNQYRKVLSYLYTATLSKICSLKAAAEPNLIIDINRYLDQAINSIQLLSDKLRGNLINNTKKKYKENIDEKITEANYFIKNEITPEIDAIIRQANEQIDALLDEIVELQKHAEAHKEEIIRKEEEMRRRLRVKTFLGILQGIFQIIGAFGPIGQSLSALYGGGLTILRSTTDNVEDISKETEFSLPPGVKSALTNTENSIKRSGDALLTVLYSRLEMLLIKLSQYPQLTSVQAAILTITKDELTALSRSGGSRIDQIIILENKVTDSLNQLEADLKSEELSSNSNVESVLQIITKFKEDSLIVGVSVELYNRNKDNNSKMNGMSKAVRESQAQIEMLESYRRSIYTTIIPVLQGMADEIHNLEDQLQVKSQVALDIAQWKIQSTLRDMRSEMQQFTKGFEIEPKLVRCIEKMDETMTTLINIYDRIQNYQEQEMLAAYIADISSPATGGIIVADSRLTAALSKLQVMIQSNVVLAQYERAVNGFKQWVFPFAHFHLAEYQLPTNMNLERNVENLVDAAVHQVRGLKSKVDDYNTSIKDYDEYIHNGNFDSNYRSSSPFFVWKGDNYQESISKLLSGEEIVLAADIRKSLSNKNAVKFNLIEINLKSENQTIQSELDSHLRHFTVMMTHMGNSYYKCMDKSYVITSDSQTISYSYEKNEDGVPISKNVVYDKINNGDLMLSPYAMWSFKLVNVTDVRFSELEKYANHVDLELIGRGQYVTDNVNVCNPTLNNYYKEISIVSSVKMQPGRHLVVSEVDRALEIIRTAMNEHKVDDDYEEEHLQFRRSISADDELDYGSGKSAASLTTASINDVFNWIKRSTSALWSKVVTPVGAISGWIANDSEALHGSLGGNLNNSTTDSSASYQFDSNGLMLLTDVIIRKFTKVKPYYPVEKFVSSNESQALALNLVWKFEDVLEQLLKTDNISLDEMEFDGPALQRKIMQNLVRGDFCQLAGVFREHVNAIPYLSNRPNVLDSLEVFVSEMIEAMDVVSINESVAHDITLPLTLPDNNLVGKNPLLEISTATKQLN